MKSYNERPVMRERSTTQEKQMLSRSVMVGVNTIRIAVLVNPLSARRQGSVRYCSKLIWAKANLPGSMKYGSSEA